MAQDAFLRPLAELDLGDELRTDPVRDAARRRAVAAGSNGDASISRAASSAAQAGRARDR